jgi:hypothetical protein
MFTQDDSVVEELVAKLEASLRPEMENARTSHYSIKLLEDAQQFANVDIDGEGRLGEHRKQGVVATRTRQQMLNLDKVDSDGTIPQRVDPKYDLNGDVAWWIRHISDSRETDSGEVEFLVISEPDNVD